MEIADRESGKKQGDLEIGVPDPQPSQLAVKERAVFDESGLGPFHRPVDGFVPPGQAADHIAGDDQRRCADQPAEQRIVGPDNRVLDDVADEQQNDEIERVELRSCSLPAKAEQEQKGRVHHHRPDELLGDGNPHREKPMRHRCHQHDRTPSVPGSGLSRL